MKNTKILQNRWSFDVRIEHTMIHIICEVCPQMTSLNFFADSFLTTLLQEEIV